MGTKLIQYLRARWKVVLVIMLTLSTLFVSSSIVIKGRKVPQQSKTETRSTSTPTQMLVQTIPPIVSLTLQNQEPMLSEGDKRLQNEWANQCSGSGPVQLTTSPMRFTDFSIIQPLGLLAGAHVTPIDHLYFSPAQQSSPRDAYPVYAMADGYISSIGRRRINVDTGGSRAEEFRIIFQHSCTFYTYFDLVTSLAPDILAQAGELQTKDYSGNIHIPVKAGQEIGRIGGQTLDTAVYNLEHRLTGFITPELYEGEAWKIHTDDFFKYFNEPLKSRLLERNIRSAEPVSGKIDYDIDGRLIGNWFLEGTKGYLGGSQNGPREYWTGHLAIVPDFIDPQAIRVSFGEFKGSAQNFGVIGNSPDPAKIDVSTGIVSYQFAYTNYAKPDGKLWDRKSVVKGLKSVTMNEVKGTVLFQLIENRRLKVEIFPDLKAQQVKGFTSNAKMYYR